MTEGETIEPKVFQCSLCPFYAAYDRHDSKYIDNSVPSTASSTQTSRKQNDPAITVDLIETVYLLRDPFVAVKEKDRSNQTKISSLIIGSTCSVCSCPVCVHSDCSVFYTRRFCLKCVAKYRDEFPREILDEIGSKRLEKFVEEAELEQQYDEI